MSSEILDKSKSQRPSSGWYLFILKHSSDTYVDPSRRPWGINTRYHKWRCYGATVTILTTRNTWDSEEWESRWTITILNVEARNQIHDKTCTSCPWSYVLSPKYGQLDIRSSQFLTIWPGQRDINVSFRRPSHNACNPWHSRCACNLV